MQTSVINYLTNFHFEYKLWAMEASFYTYEMKLYSHWLHEIAAKQGDRIIGDQVKAFMTKFHTECDHLDVLNKQLDHYESWFSVISISQCSCVHHQFNTDHNVLRQQVQSFEKRYENLKTDFKYFVETLSSTSPKAKCSQGVG